MRSPRVWYNRLRMKDYVRSLQPKHSPVPKMQEPFFRDLDRYFSDVKEIIASVSAYASAVDSAKEDIIRNKRDIREALNQPERYIAKCASRHLSIALSMSKTLRSYYLGNKLEHSLSEIKRITEHIGKSHSIELEDLRHRRELLGKSLDSYRRFTLSMNRFSRSHVDFRPYIV